MKRFFSFAPFAAAVLLFSACSKSPLHEPMEEIGDAYSAIKKAEDLNTVSGTIDEFVAAIEIAKAQTLPEGDQETFNEGINKTLDLAKALKASVASGDMDTARQIIKELGETEEKYHEEFGVEE